MKFSYLYFISALKNKNIYYIIQSLHSVYLACVIHFSTYKLNKIIINFNNFVKNLKKNFKFKINYAHQGGKNPPLIIIHSLNMSKFNKYHNNLIENILRKYFNLKGTPLKIKYCS